MRVAVVGCSHGELDAIYDTIRHIDQQHPDPAAAPAEEPHAQGTAPAPAPAPEGPREAGAGPATAPPTAPATEPEAKTKCSVDLLICCGDFQAVRNEADLSTMACPVKYRQLNNFHEYYSGLKTAPCLTIFVGGNHEASNHLWELPFGGWVAPKIYFLGYAGVVKVGGLRIAGLSGIFNRRHYDLGHFEAPPYDDDSMRSAYHIRSLEVFRLNQLKRGGLDVFISHDWPRGIARFGNLPELLRKKSFLRDEINDNSLGSPPGEFLMQNLRPRYWFAAHLHVKFAAVVEHTHPPEEPQTTRFLALSKPLPRQQFLQVLEFPNAEGKEIALEYDEEWCAVLRSTSALWTTSRGRVQLPMEHGPVRWDYVPTDDELAFVRQRFEASPTGSMVPENFEQSAPVHDPSSQAARQDVGPRLNAQTVAFCDLVQVSNPCAPYVQPGLQQPVMQPPLLQPPVLQPPAPLLGNPDEIDLDADMADEEEEAAAAASAAPAPATQTTAAPPAPQGGNPDEIDLDSD